VTPSEVEAWARDVLRRVAAGQPCEDSRVEIKSEWPTDHRRAARQIAALANSSHADHVLWIIGADEHAMVVNGAAHVEISEWYAKVGRCFDELTPNMRPVNVPWNEKTAVALLFEVGQPPYVVKTASGAQVDREVPWRHGNDTRSAKRSQLLDMLLLRAAIPQVEVLSAWLRAKVSPKEDSDGNKPLSWTLNASIYMVPSSPGLDLVFPFHRCSGEVDIPRWRFHDEARLPLRIWIDPARGSTDPARLSQSVSMIRSGPSEIVVGGPGQVQFWGNASSAMPAEHPACAATVRLRLSAVQLSEPVDIMISMDPVQPDRGPQTDQYGVWEFH
jgi:hypothetical protein